MRLFKNAAKTFLTLLLVFSLLLSCCSSFSGMASSELEKAQNSYDEAKEKYDKLKTQKASAEEQLEAAQSAYYALVKQVEALNKSISVVRSEIEKLEKQIAEYKVRIDKKQAEMDKKYSEFCSRLKALYISGSMSALQVIAECEDFSDYLTRLEMVTKVSEKDSAVIKELEAMLEELERLQQELESDRGKQEAKRNELQTKKADLEIKKAAAADSLAECEDLMNTIKSAQADAEKDMKAALAQINKLSASGGIKGTGQLCYPVPSCMTVSCGFYGYANHNGVDFASGPGLFGAAVVASDDGQVVGADYWDYSYGYHVTIDHGNGMKTIYCHMSAISVKVGQNVKKGQTIGAVGCSGNVIPRGRGGTHCHFGVVVNGAFVNPFNYL